ncbi:MAG: beta-L-arabinofuranosidase domain-containing protein, partial [Segetibacter sp.]
MRKKLFITGSFIFLFSFLSNELKAQSLSSNKNYINNRLPLKANPYIELPLGAIKAEGWLKEQLIRMKDGMTGQLDKLYPQVMGKRNGWLGGDGDVWERGPYWIDGLLPLAYILDDANLKAKAQEWIEWSIKNQDPSGYFGPIPPAVEPPKEEGLQRDKARDWWPKMVMLKVLQQYYNATKDQRVINLMTKYFQYQLKELPAKKLDNWSWWGAQRGGDNLLIVYWLYNLTGDKSLLELAELLHKQTVDWTGMMEKGEIFQGYFKLHGVNLAQGIKEPLIYYQQHPEQKYYAAVKKGFKDIQLFHGQPQGLYGADEWLHGTDPANGSELCTAVEMMYSLENILQITGDPSFADHIEKITFNALPTQSTDNYMERQYYQQPNQVMITRQERNFYTNYQGTDQVLGLLSGYPCCTANMHQGWPKFAQNLWYASADGGVAALLFAPSTVTVNVANKIPVTITETTNYPFTDNVQFKIKTNGTVSFPFHLRIPNWCKEAVVKINGNEFKKVFGDTIAVVNRNWKNGDVVELQLPMTISRSRWHENSVVVERGPLLYALKIKEDWKKVESADKFGSYYEVKPLSPWNYGLVNVSDANLQSSFKVSLKPRVALFPWTPEDAPIEIKVPAKVLKDWQIYNGSSGPVPYSVQKHTENLPVQEVTLI